MIRPKLSLRLCFVALSMSLAAAGLVIVSAAPVVTAVSTVAMLARASARFGTAVTLTDVLSVGPQTGNTITLGTGTVPVVPQL